MRCHSDVATEALTAAEVTVDALTPIVSGITGIIVDATAKVNALVGVEVDVILATADGSAQITVGAMAQLLSALMVVRLLLPVQLLGCSIFA